MSYSRLIESSWYCYPTELEGGKHAVCCIRGNGFDTYFWTGEQSKTEFLKEVGETMQHDEFWKSDLLELEKILDENREDISSELGISWDKWKSLHCNACGKNVKIDPDDDFMLHEELWAEACEKGGVCYDDVLCKKCVEDFIGRKLTAADLADMPCNEKHKQEWK